MEAQDHREGSSGEEISDGEVNFRDTNYVNDDDDDLYYTSGSGCPSKLQFRRDVSKACWNQEIRVAEVLEKKGKMWTTTGIVRGGQTYCFLEETLFLAEIGAMHLVDDNDTCLTLKDIHEKVAEGKSGCCYEFFQVYRQLKSLGYIVGRYGVPWTFKSSKSASTSHSLKEEDSIVELFSNMRVNESLRPAFDVYHPNSRFRKTAPGDPSFVLCLARGSPPSEAEIQALEKQCNGIPLKFCHTEHGRPYKPMSKLLCELSIKSGRVIIGHDFLLGSVVQEACVIPDVELHTFHSLILEGAYIELLGTETEALKQSKQKFIRVLRAHNGDVLMGQV